VKGKLGSLAALGGLMKSGAGTRSALVLIALAALCSYALAQEMTAEDLYKKGHEMYENGSYQEAVEAYDEGLKMNPQNASAWHYRGMALASMGRGVEANRSLEKAIGSLDQMLLVDPKDPEALWLRA